MIAAVYILLGALLWSVLSHVAAGYRAERKRLRILEAMGDNFARALAESVASRQPQSGAAEASRHAGDAASGCADSDGGCGIPNGLVRAVDELLDNPRVADFMSGLGCADSDVCDTFEDWVYVKD